MFEVRTALFLSALVLALPGAGAATTCNSVAACVLGNNTGSGVGLEGISVNNVALYGASTKKYGIEGRSRTSYGVVGYTDAAGTTAQAGVIGIDLTGYNSGVEGVSQYSYGVVGRGQYGVEGIGTSNNGPAFNPGIGVFGSGTTSGGFFENQSATEPTLILYNSGSGPLLEGDAIPDDGSSGGVAIRVDRNGNLFLGGYISEGGAAQIRTRTTGADVTSYAARTSSPTLEDFGASTLQKGTASVALEHTFASAINARSYMVFITPHGNSNGLFAEIYANRFVVHENNNGHSSIAFDYRIVAKPLDAKFARLPTAVPLHLVATSKIVHTMTALRVQH